MISALDVFAKNESAHVWRELPQMISSGTSVVPSAVILTQSDRLPVTERDNSAARFKEIREEFWPDATSTSVYQVYECSVLQGRSGKALLHAIESSDELPVATLWRTHAYYALAVTLDAETLKEAEELIQTVERGDLKSSAKRIQTRGNMDNTTNGLFGLCEMAANKNTALEAQGVGRRILQLLGGLRSLLHELNLFNYEQLEVLDAQSKLEQEQSSLLIEWAEKEGLLTRDYQRISRETRDALDERVEVSVLDAAEKSRQSNDVSAFDVTIDHNGVYFLSENAVDAFLASLRDRLMVLQEQTLASEEEYVHLAKKRHFSDLAKKAGQLDSTIEAPLLSLLSQNDLKTLLPEIKIPDSTKDELVTKQRITLRRSRGYKAAQERTLAWITRGQSHSIDKLSPLARSLLGLAAFFSYLLTFPISRHPEEATVYYVQLDRVVTALKTIISTSWDDSVSQVLQKRLQDEAERGKDLIGRAVQFAASQSTDFKDAPPAELSKSMQKIILTGYLNLIGAQASQEMIAVELST
ncbi:hypothetical protein FRC19_005332 [Serendipita sp. 401]|nr:hypothetical protein FRC19_005332 [Serendipita sp. 401]